METNVYETAVQPKNKASPEKVAKCVLILIVLIGFLLTVIMLIYVMARVDEIDGVSKEQFSFSVKTAYIQ